jgi:hypothetical protein
MDFSNLYHIIYIAENYYVRWPRAVGSAENKRDVDEGYYPSWMD